MEVVDGEARARQGMGDWETLDDFTDAFAPQGDFLSFLVASAEVEAHSPETRNGIDFTRYTFTIDGPTFAAFVRDQAQTRMQRGGELAPGMHVQVSPAYVCQLIYQARTPTTSQL